MQNLLQTPKDAGKEPRMPHFDSAAAQTDWKVPRVHGRFPTWSSKAFADLGLQNRVSNGRANSSPKDFGLTV